MQADLRLRTGAWLQLILLEKRGDHGELHAMCAEVFDQTQSRSADSIDRSQGFGGKKNAPASESCWKFILGDSSRIL